jgi:hypothetical protein
MHLINGKRDTKINACDGCLAEVFCVRFHDSVLSNVTVCWIFFYSRNALDLSVSLVKTDLVLVVLFVSSVLTATAPIVCQDLCQRLLLVCFECPI